jgi:hypothetical protein
MPTDKSADQSRNDTDIRAGMLKRGRQLIIQNLIIGATLFIPAGTLGLW